MTKTIEWEKDLDSLTKAAPPVPDDVLKKYDLPSRSEWEKKIIKIAGYLGCNSGELVREVTKLLADARLEVIAKEKKKKLKKICPHCNNTGKVWNSFLGNYVPCETENNCLIFSK